ncbi:MAG TPA: LamG-like jellyroll fold domain-containing protein [Polyangiaceae bacterium]
MTQPVNAWFDLSGYTKVQGAGTDAPKQKVLNFIGVTVADDPTNNRTNVTFTGGGSLSGDVTGPTSATVVGKLNGATVPASPGSGDTGKALTVSGAGAYALTALAGDVTGAVGGNTVAKINGATVPSSPLSGDAGKFFTVSGAGAYTLVDAAGDVTGPVTALVVAKINGGTAPATPGSGDTGKAIIVTGAGAYGLGSPTATLPSRLQPTDGNTQIQWSFDNGNVVSGTPNGGVGGTLNLFTGWAGSSINPTPSATGLFDLCWWLDGTQGLKTNDTSVGESATSWTAIWWVKLTAYASTGSPNTPELWDKKYQTGNTWTSPFTSVGSYMDQTNPGAWTFNITIGGTHYFATPAGGQSTFPTAGSNQFIQGAFAIPLGEWVMLAATYDGTTLSVYFNGSLCATNQHMTSGSSIDWGSHGAYQVGAVTTQSNSGITGFLDEMRIESVVRSPSYLLAMYKAGVNRSDP